MQSLLWLNWWSKYAHLTKENSPPACSTAAHRARSRHSGFGFCIAVAVRSDTSDCLRIPGKSNLIAGCVIFCGRTVVVQAMEAGLGFENPNPWGIPVFHGNLTRRGGTVTDLLVSVLHRALARPSLSRDVESSAINPIAPGERGQCAEQPCGPCASARI